MRLSEENRRGCPTCNGIDPKSCLRCRGRTRMCDWYETERGWGYVAATVRPSKIDPAPDAERVEGGA